MTLRYYLALLATAAPLFALAGVWSGLLPQQRTVPLWYLLLAAPVWEELFFRGALQRRLLQQPWGTGQIAGVSKANLLTAAAFVLAHLPFQGWRGLLIVLPALALGRLFEQGNRLLCCVLLHGWFNLCWVMILQITA